MTMATTAAEQEVSPLLSRGPSHDDAGSYGAAEGPTLDIAPSAERQERGGRGSISVRIDHDIVNHGHAYSDAIADAAVLEDDPSVQGTDARVSYWNLLRGNENFRWYLMSYLVTHAGE